MNQKNELKLIAAGGFKTDENFYKIVDFLNKNLKGYGIVFGMTRTDGKDIISIYESGDE